MSKKNQLTRTDYLSVEEYQKLVSCLHDDGDVLGETYTRVAKGTALRISDVLKLTWKKLLNERFVLNEQKTGKRRSITVSEKTQDTFNMLYELNGKPNKEEPIFLNRRSGKTYTKQYINRLMKEWKEKYDICVGNFSSHSFRKSFGREYWDKSGCSDKALVNLSEIYNHSDISITRRYLGIRDEELSQVYEVIEV
jgi:integrase